MEWAYTLRSERFNTGFWVKDFGPVTVIIHEVHKSRPFISYTNSETPEREPILSGTAFESVDKAKEYAEKAFSKYVPATPQTA